MDTALSLLKEKVGMLCCPVCNDGSIAKWNFIAHSGHIRFDMGFPGRVPASLVMVR